MVMAVPEERLVLYSAAEQQYCTGLLRGFAARHPGIEVEFVFGISPALRELYLADISAGRPGPDVFWSSGMDLQLQLVREGHAQPHPSPEAAAMPEGSVWRNQAFATTLEPLVTLVHRDHFDVQQPAQSLAELAAVFRRDAGRLHGRVAACDIERNGIGFLALLHESRDAAVFEAFMQGFAGCEPRLHGAAPMLVDDVASGRAALACHVLGSYAERAVRANPSLAIAASAVPALAFSRIAFIPRRAPHPHAARLFLDYLISCDGQQHLGEAGLYPMRADTRPAGFPVARELAPIRIDSTFGFLLDEGNRARLLSRWRALIATPAPMC